MSESNDYDPGPWTGHDFKSARKAFDVNAGRSYADAVSSGITAGDLIPDFITTDSECPLIIFSDVTGSMGVWPAVMFSKLPYLENEGKQYLGQTMEICFAAIGDAYSDQYPLQVRPFSKGLDLKVQLEALVQEGNGGGQSMESYDLGALYAARNLKTPKAVRRPIVIFIGDENTYPTLKPDIAKRYARVNQNETLSDKAIFDELKENASVYLIHKRYDRSSEEMEIKRHWVSLLGEEYVADLDDPQRVVDVIFGILAKEVNRVDYFHAEIEDRQNPDQVATVYRSLATVHRGAMAHTGKSIMLNPSKGTKSRSLLDE